METLTESDGTSRVTQGGRTDRECEMPCAAAKLNRYHPPTTTMPAHTCISKNSG